MMLQNHRIDTAIQRLRLIVHVPPDRQNRKPATSSTKSGREIAGLFREGEAEQTLRMKRADGHAMLVGGDRNQVIARIADLTIARRDILLGSGSRRGITVTAPTNEDVADISQAIRARLKERGEIVANETVHRAIDQ